MLWEAEEYEGFLVLNIEKLVYINVKLKWWIAKLKGLHPKYKFDRVFLPSLYLPDKKYRLPLVPFDKFKLLVNVGDVLEVCGRSRKNERRKYFLVSELLDNGVSLEEKKLGEVVKLFKGKKEIGSDEDILNVRREIEFF